MKTEICIKWKCKDCKRYNQCFKNESKLEKQVVIWQKANTLRNS